MKAIMVSMVAAAGIVLAGSAIAADVPAAGAKCSMCHALDTKKMGPSYKDIAAKFKGDANAVANLEAAITKGGKFGWNMGMMPPKGMASDADIKAMAEYIAGLAK